FGISGKGGLLFHIFDCLGYRVMMSINDPAIPCNQRHNRYAFRCTESRIPARCMTQLAVRTGPAKVWAITNITPQETGELFLIKPPSHTQNLCSPANKLTS